MNIKMQKGESPDHLDFENWDLALWGEPLDDRGREAQSFLRDKVNQNFKLEYKSESFEVELDERRFQIEDLEGEFKRLNSSRVIIECTTLGFIEILVSLRYLKDLSSEIYLLYLEPNSYKKTERLSVLHKREFELSQEITGFRAIPGFAIRLSDKEPQKGVFFLGFESSRLDRAFEEFQMLQSKNCAVVFGVPAFKAGWEMNSFANNIRVLNEKNISGGIYFSGADNPKSALKKLKDIYEGLAKTDKFFIAPLGPKPSSIGAAVFLNDHPDTGVIYDHPRELEERSDEVLNWNIYEIIK